MMSIKFGIIFLTDLLFPLLQGPGPLGPDPGGDPGIPITGGIIWLLAAALGVGIKAFSKKNRY